MKNSTKGTPTVALFSLFMLTSVQTEHDCIWGTNNLNITHFLGINCKKKKLKIFYFIYKYGYRSVFHISCHLEKIAVNLATCV